MTGGVKAALDAAVEDAYEGPEAEAFVQATLFDLDESETGSLDAPSPLAQLVQPVKRAGPGRPSGSKNRRTEKVAAWLLQQHRHPVKAMMEAYSMSPADFAAAIGLRKATREVVTKRTLADGSKEEIRREVELEYYDNATLMEIVKLQLRMAEAAAPYVAQKLPQAVQIGGAAGLTVQFAGVSVPARAGVSVNSDVVEGEVMRLRLPVKSDEESRTDT